MDYKSWSDRLVQYQYIEELLEGRQVLEVGCGSGEGADYAADRAALVYGVETSDEAVRTCNKTYSRPNLNFRRFDTTSFSFGDRAFDMVLVPELARWLQWPEFLDEVRRVLRPSGLVFCATASGDREGDGLAMTFDALQTFLGRGWPNVRVVGALPFLGYTMADFAPEGEPETVLDCSLVDEDEPPMSYLALCCDLGLDPQTYAVMQLPHRAETITSVTGSAEQEQAPATDLDRETVNMWPERSEPRRRDPFGRERTPRQSLTVDANRRVSELERRLDQERLQLENERDRAEDANRKYLELNSEVEVARVRAESAERALQESRSAVALLGKRAESAERRCDSLMNRIEQGAGETSQLHHRIAELQAEHQTAQWKVDELTGRLRSASHGAPEERPSALRRRRSRERPTDDGTTRQLQQAQDRERALKQEIKRLRLQLDKGSAELRRTMARSEELQRCQAELAQAREAMEQGGPRVEKVQAEAEEARVEVARLEKELMKSESRVVEQTRRGTNCEAKMAQMEVKLKRATKEAATLSKWANELREDLAEAQGKSTVRPLTPEPEVAALRNDLKQAEERVKALEERCDRFMKRAEQAQTRVREQEALVAELRRSNDDQAAAESAGLRQKAQRAEALERDLEQTQQKLRRAEATLRDNEQAAQELARAQQELDGMRARMAEVDAASEELEQLRASSGGDSEVSAALERTLAQKQELEQQLEAMQADLTGARESKNRALGQLEKARERLAASEQGGEAKPEAPAASEPASPSADEPVTVSSSFLAGLAQKSTLQANERGQLEQAWAGVVGTPNPQAGATEAPPPSEAQAMHAELSEVRAELSRAEARAEEAEQGRERAEAASGRSEELALQLAEAQADLQTARDDLDEAEAELAKAREETAESDRQAAALEAFRANKTADVELAQVQQEQAVEPLSNDVAVQLEILAARLERREARVKSLEQGAAAHRREMAKASARQAELNAFAEEQRQAGLEAETTLEACRAQVAALKQTNAELRRENIDLVRRVAQLEGELERASRHD